MCYVWELNTVVAHVASVGNNSILMNSFFVAKSTSASIRFRTLSGTVECGMGGILHLVGSGPWNKDNVNVRCEINYVMGYLVWRREC